MLGRGGDANLTRQIGNFILLFGCQPATGVLAESKYVKNFINLIIKNFDESGSVILPDALSRVMSSDAPFESVSSNLARKIKLNRQDTVVGHKRLFYAIDLTDNTRQAVRT